MFFLFHQVTSCLSFIYALHYGFADTIKWMLSIKFWMVFDRLGFSLIAGHVLVLKWYYYTKSEPATFGFMAIVIILLINTKQG